MDIEELKTDTIIDITPSNDSTEDRPSSGKSMRSSLRDNLNDKTIEPKETKIDARDPEAKIAKSFRDQVKNKIDAPREEIKVIPVSPISVNTGIQNQDPQQTRMMVAAPADMKAEEKDAFNKLSPEMQQYVSRRSYEYQSDHSRKVNQLKEVEKELGDVYSVVTPQLRDEYSRQGIAVPDLIRRSVAWDKAFKTNKVGAAFDHLDSYGITLEDLIAARQNGVYQDKQPEYLTREDAEKIAIEKSQQLFQEQEQSHLAYQSQSAVKSFLGTKPLFRDPGTALQLESAIANEIIGLKAQGIDGSPQELLEMGYERVTKLHPVFSNLVNQLNQRQEDERKNAEALKAQAASRSIKGSPGSGTPKYKANSFRESLEYNISK